MPSTRSAASKEESSTSSDWSMNTPSDATSSTSTGTSVATRSTLTRRTPPPSTSRSRSPTTAAGTEPSQEEDRHTSTVRSAQDLKTSHPAYREGSQPAAAELERSVAKTTHRMESETTSLEGSLQRPQARKPTYESDTQVVRPAHRMKKSDAQARRRLALQELAVAEARLKLAQARLKLAQADMDPGTAESDEEDAGEAEEMFEQAGRTTTVQEVEKWVIDAGVRSDEGRKPTEEKNEVKELAKAILKMSGRTRDVIELPNFHGACEEWLAFKRSYEDTAATFSNAQNLARLRRSILGKAKETVQSLLFTAEDPQEVIEALELGYGRPGALARAELEKLKKLSRVSEDPGDVCVFASKVRNAVETIKALKKPHLLASDEALRAIVEKMPSAMKYRWYNYHQSRRDEEDRGLLLIKDFLENEAKVYGDYAAPEVSTEQKKLVRKPVHTAQATPEKRSSCPACEEEHFAPECKKFKDAAIEERWSIIKKARICFKCLRYRHSRMNCKAPDCKRCGRWHHTLLHSDNPTKPVKKNTSYEKNEYVSEEEEKEKVASIHNARGVEKAYLKIIPVDLYGPKGQARVLALLDEGSTITLLDASVAEKIGAKGVKEALAIETVGGKILRKDSSQKIKMKIRGAHRRDKKTIVARTIDDLKLSEQSISRDTLKKCQHLRGIEEQLHYVAEKPKLLIGQDNWGLIVTRRLKKGKPAEPVASFTSLGWVLHGCEAGVSAVVNFVHYGRSATEDVEEIVREHFQLESLGIQDRLPSNDSDRRALEVLEKTTRRLESGQYETGLLWKKEEEVLPNNYNQALRRLVGVEKKLDQDKETRESYEQQIQNLLEKGYAEKAPEDSDNRRKFYLPHFAVIHPVKKKPRIVFDAAAKYEGKSLNDTLLSGPDLLQSLFGVLLRFREGPIAVMADIQDMFLRVKVREEDRDSLRFLWRGSRRTGKPEEFRMSSIIFGAASSPATAIFVMNKNAEDFKETHPEAVKAINRNHYMDDYLQSFSSATEAKKISQQVRKIHERASLYLKGWASNDSSVLAEIEDCNPEDSMQLTKEEKTLGLRWLVKEDVLAFNLGLRNTPKDLLDGRRPPTKREVTSAVMSTFDPMGFATPVLIQGKKLIQDIWRTKIDWDEAISEKQMEAWMKYLREVTSLSQLRIPRCISPYSKQGQLHTFSDASEEAYAAVVYWRTVDPGGNVHIAMVAGKARVTPTKPVSIPRLELQAALLGSRLASSIEEEMELQVTQKTFWTDSSTVLQWIKAEPRKFKTFVANRLAEIEERTRPEDWRWVPTKENPADDATRGTPIEFDHHARWFRGPAFLLQREEEWPSRSFSAAEVENEEMKVMVTRAVEDGLLDLNRFSSWERLLRTTARVITFVSVLRQRVRGKTNASVRRSDEPWKPQRRVQKKTQVNHQPIYERKRSSFLPMSNEHLRRAEELLLKMSQHESFASEIKSLKMKKPLENSSKLKKIDVYIGDNGLIKLRSRTMKFQDEGNRSMNPFILDGKQKITRLIIQHYHKKFLHGNTATVMNEIRQKYWVLGLRTTLKAVSHNCQWCKTKKSSPGVPPMGDLPSERLRHHEFPFSYAAVDYFGPMHVTIGRRAEKRWGALFTCLTTRAVHLELVPSLSTSSMIMALRRMAARRGSPKVIFSDNGTNFVGANKELEEAAQEKGIKWKFIPPGCPNMGGAWERLVRTVKTALTAVLNERSPPEEVLHTLMTEVEHIVNSRPLTPVSMDPGDEESLTPNHFLLGRSCGAMAPGEFDDSVLIGKASWKTTQKLADHFWRRWVKEYLPLLMPRRLENAEVNDPKQGDVVLIVDATLPRNSWPRGEVMKTYPGPDGRTRILDVRTPGGVLRRPTRRVIVLVPAESSPQLEDVQRTVGENVSDD